MSGGIVMSKNVIFIADSLDSAHKIQQVLSKMEIDVSYGPSSQFRTLLRNNESCDLVIYEIGRNPKEAIKEVTPLLSEKGSTSALFMLSPEQLPNLRLPMQFKSDFIVRNATEEECDARIRMLLWPGNEATSQEFITVENMSINLATYQVKIGDEPLDLTYLEYALLAFLVTHPGRTYSRDTLLNRVWGFDYYGGSRTVDVHVRRVRAKLGPELAQHLETVRGVGYLWNM